MSKKTENTGFICAHCGADVKPLERSYRNHCPFCLHSLHVDVEPGDRASDCGGVMKPIDITFSSQKGYQILHECQKCGFRRLNKRAEGSIQPDSQDVILELMRQKQYRDTR